VLTQSGHALLANFLRQATSFADAAGSGGHCSFRAQAPLQRRS